ncbi:MAG: TetR/AcrR family transcriptional regulator [Clostridia bacterium]|nr:TetR/AcrR family transcriptional regulator [Clostridia bacterium]
MAKRTEKGELRRSEIIEAALGLFLEKGYEGTSIRMIQYKVGKEVGLFYHYFDSKDDVFAAAMELFFKKYEDDMQRQYEAGRDAPDRELTKYFDYIQQATYEFRERYIDIMHWSILGAIRENTLRIMRKYIHLILSNYIEKGLLDVRKEDIESLSGFIAFGVGCSVLYQTNEQYALQRNAIVCNVARVLGIEPSGI